MKKNSNGLSQHPLRNVWKNMISRCHNENDKDFHYYGGRGITVFQAWFNLAVFIEALPKRPSKRHTLDRIDVNGNYEPNNVKWSTWKQQHKNKR